jgi:hypothetical protein
MGANQRWEYYYVNNLIVVVYNWCEYLQMIWYYDDDQYGNNHARRYSFDQRVIVDLLQESKIK